MPPSEIGIYQSSHLRGRYGYKRIMEHLKGLHFKFVVDGFCGGLEVLTIIILVFYLLLVGLRDLAERDSLGGS